MIKPTEAMGHENVTEFILLELFTDENVKVACFVIEPKKRKSITASTFSPSICHEVMGTDAMILVFLNI